MPMTVLGTTGSVNARNVSRSIAMPHAEIGYVTSNSARQVFPIAGSRQVQVAGGGAISGFVRYDESGGFQALTAFPAPASGKGQWYLIVDEINFTGGSVAPRALLGPSTSSSVPTAIPSDDQRRAISTWRGEFPTNVGGDTWHVPLAWVWVRQQDNTVGVWDLRILRGGMPAQFATNHGILTFPRNGTGYDAWSQSPTVGFLGGNGGQTSRLDMPAGVYTVRSEFSVGSTAAAIGYHRIEQNGVNISNDIRVDVGEHNLLAWSKDIIHNGGTLLIESKMIVALPGGGAVSGSVQNGSGFVQLSYKSRLNRVGY